MRAKRAWLVRRCRIGNDFPTVLHAEGQRRERERENSRVFGFLRRTLRRAFSARSAQRTCTKGALVHVSCFSASNPSRILSRMVSQAIGLSCILSRMVSRCRGANNDNSCSRGWRGDSIPTRNQRAAKGSARWRYRREGRGRSWLRSNAHTNDRGSLNGCWRIMMRSSARRVDGAWNGVDCAVNLKARGWSGRRKGRECNYGA